MKLLVNGEEFELDKEERLAMELLVDMDTAEGKEASERNFDHLDAKSVKLTVQLLRLVNCKFPDIGKVKSNKPEEYMGKEITEFLDKLTSTFFDNCRPRNQWTIQGLPPSEDPGYGEMRGCLHGLQSLHPP